MGQSELSMVKMAHLRPGLKDMDNLEKMLAEKLGQSDVHFDASGADAEVFKIAHQDLINYLKHHWGMVGKEDCALRFADQMSAALKEEPAEFEAFLSFWTGMWQRKWAQRVKLLIGNQSEGSKKFNASSLPSDAESLWKDLHAKKEIADLVVSALVKSGEFCATELLAEKILRAELARNIDSINSREQAINLLNAALRRARDMAKTVSPIIFVKVDRGYYHTATV